MVSVIQNVLLLDDTTLLKDGHYFVSLIEFGMKYRP